MAQRADSERIFKALSQETYTSPDILHGTTRHDFQETWTADDGRWFTVSGHYLFKDIRLKRVEGTLYEGVFNIPGQTSTITDPSGRTVRKDSGNVSFDYTIDFADGSFNVVSAKVAGPHPSFDTDALPGRGAADRR